MGKSLGFLFDRTETPEHVPNREILSYATGLAGQNISYNFISNRLTYFYENHAVSEKNASVVGKIMTATYVWDAINDVLIGAWIDGKTHKPFQKLRPYLWYLPPVIGLLGALMFLNIGSNDVFKLVYLGFCYFLWDFFYSFQDVGLWGLIALSSPLSHERARVAQWVSIGAGAGSTIGGAFPIIWDILKNFSVPERRIFTIFAFVFGLGGEILSMRAHKFRERIDAPAEKHESIMKSVAVLRHNPTLLLISLARFSLGLSPKINQTYFFQSEYRETSMAGSVETVYGILGGIPGATVLFFANKIIDLVGGMKNLLILSQVTAIITRVIAFFAGRTGVLSYKTVPGFIVMCLLIAICNIPGSLMDIAHRSLTSDSIDEVELKTGLRTEGISFSMQNFTTKLTSGASTFIQNFFLYRVLGYKAYDDENYIAMQGEKFYKMQFPLFMLGPVAGAVLYIIIISFVKDDKNRRAEVEAELRIRREKAGGAEQTV